MSENLNNTLDVSRPTPRAYSFSKPFWEATREKKVVIQYCPATGNYQFFPKPVSVFTGKSDLEWREVSGRGEVFTYTTACMARPPFAGHTPFLIATITLDEGVNMIANVINCAADQISVGMRVRPAWIPLPDGANLLVFEPDEPAGA
ncbi:MAG TPA: Zn-ribbon domain-containing OB-fold protein [Allosphingosinicella sp.]|nr:Zn-ribbon domain-containing OB-fold protein [Allosphingosinicella sp.]HKT14560.1 Zn-ribbon domain-containing OB-fold protein [Allosphingosinicella sp.]